MELYKITKISGCAIYKNKIHRDFRGTFEMTHNQIEYHAAGLEHIWSQDNVSITKKNVLRGLHIQSKNPQGKLIRCLKGTIYDVCVDLRKNSPTFRQHVTQILSEDNGYFFYVPEGCAHGFLSLSDESIVLYKCTSIWNPKHDGGIKWDDPELAVGWPIEAPILSPKDSALPSLADYLDQMT